jgi:hypothetical protein
LRRRGDNTGGREGHAVFAIQSPNQE